MIKNHNEIYYLRRENCFGFSLMPIKDLELNIKTGTWKKVLRDYDRKAHGVFVKHYLHYLMVYTQNRKLIIQINQEKFPVSPKMQVLWKEGIFNYFKLSLSGKKIYSTYYKNPELSLMEFIDWDGNIWEEDVFHYIYLAVEQPEEFSKLYSDPPSD